VLSVGGLSFTAGAGAIDRISERVACAPQNRALEIAAGRDEP